MNANVKAILIALVIYVGLGWIIKDIFFSMFKVSGNTTIDEIYNYEIWIYAVIGTVYNFYISRNNTNDGWIMENIPLAPIYSAIIFTGVLPMGVGASLLNTVICLGSMIYVGCKSEHFN